MLAEKMDDTHPLADRVEELSLLLPGWQLMALAETAESQGMTVAQFLRRLVSRALAPVQDREFDIA